MSLITEQATEVLPALKTAQTQHTNNTVTPSSDLRAEDGLSTYAPTGYQVRMKMPFGAENGPVPIFMYRVSPIAIIPDIRTSNYYPIPTAYAPAIAGDTNWGNQYMNASIQSNKPGRLNCIPLNGSEVTITGCMSMLTTMALLHRRHRVQMDYRITMTGSFIGSGALTVVPYFNIPDGQLPFDRGVAANAGPELAAAMSTVNMGADFSKDRNLEISFPYVNNTEYCDVRNEMFRMNANSGLTATDNWFVVFARGTFDTSDNIPYITFFIDHRANTFDFQQQLLPFQFAVDGVVPTMPFYDKDSKVRTLYFRYDETPIPRVTVPRRIADDVVDAEQAQA